MWGKAGIKVDGEKQLWENREEEGKNGQSSVSILLVLTLSGQASRNPLGPEVLHIWLL